MAATVGAVVVSTVEVLVVVASTGVPVFVAVAFVMAVLMAAITDFLMRSSSAAFPGGGAGAIRTDITVTTITRTITMDTGDTRMVTMDTVATRAAMDTAGTITMVAAVMAIAMEAERVMDMAMPAEPVTHIALAADQPIPGVRGVGDKPGLRIGVKATAHFGQARSAIRAMLRSRALLAPPADWTAIPRTTVSA